MPLKLYNFNQSAYGRIVEIVLREKNLSFERTEINPFAEDVPEDYVLLHPFQRVPVLQHDGFTLYETNAITEYLDDAFPEFQLKPQAPEIRARMRQIIALIDNYGYWPLVRMVFAERVSKPLVGDVPDMVTINKGLIKSADALAALEFLTEPGGFLVGESYTLADAHVIPMVDYFCRTPEGQEVFAGFPKLSNWWDRLQIRPSTLDTRPD